ncbi:xylulokinase [Pseudooceanicola algae]|uniref:Xylulose kinase n=1 Tax=Pseudooceanicola algae TaxID=1537215 RepID=A0A418SDS3_9RHOB|nr:xylulokinase [Pseudooceanicola algae]QPM89480.1 Xylulose kinase [Pseudooceanicola algae]
MTTYLGLDLGTSGLRALLIDAGGGVIGAAEAACSVSQPYPGWSEQDPAQWIAALDQVMAALKASHPAALSALAGIGTAGHMHGATLLDASGAVIRPCILWNDTRSHAEAARLDALDGVRDLSGNIVFPGFTAPKLDWVRLHEPESFSRIAKVLLPAAYLNFHLTGETVADMSDAAGTSWLDTGARDWSDDLLAAGHMRRDQMPRLVEGCEAGGILRAELAAAWGIAGPVTIAGGAGDNAAAACGTGCLSEGQGFVSLGTSGVLLAARDGYHPDADSALHTFCHAVPGRWYQMGVMLSATDSLNWLGRITGRRPAELSADLGDLRGPGQTRFLPYLAGERTPYNDAAIRGAFTGLASATDTADLTRAVMEGVAYGLRDTAQAMKAVGARPEALLMIGGGSASEYWVELMATVLDMPMLLPARGEFGAALGAARLGQIAATGAAPEDLLTRPEIAHEVPPNRALTEQFNAGYDRFRAAYPAIREIQ